MRVFILTPIFLLFLVGCANNNELKNNQEPQRDEKFDLIIPKVLDRLENEKKLNEIKNRINDINIDESKLNLKINDLSNTPLDALDECLASKKKEGLPIYECTKLLKP